MTDVLFLPDEYLTRRYPSVAEWPWPERLRLWILTMEVAPDDPYSDIHTMRRCAIFNRNQIDTCLSKGEVSPEQAEALRLLLDEKVKELNL